MTNTEDLSTFLAKRAAGVGRESRRDWKSEARGLKALPIAVIRSVSCRLLIVARERLLILGYNLMT
jgi:hypothetical protein